MLIVALSLSRISKVLAVVRSRGTSTYATFDSNVKLFIMMMMMMMMVMMMIIIIMMMTSMILMMMTTAMVVVMMMMMTVPAPHITQAVTSITASTGINKSQNTLLQFC